MWNVAIFGKGYFVGKGSGASLFIVTWQRSGCASAWLYVGATKD